ncbi:MAG: MinD/ParA family protein [Phycisphaeraceae bacterium]|nr:MinD/ParA family protein [Phycisphaeraceae bacterium]
MITDQAQALREQVERRSRPELPPGSPLMVEAANPATRTARGAATTGATARTIAVTSGKGGVGKTTLSVNLAVQLSSMHRRVVLLDADLGTANADVLCNLSPASTLAHVVAGRKRLEEVLIDAPGGFRLVPGASGLAQMAALSEFERSRLLAQLHQLETRADVILIDTGAGVSPNVLGFLVAADEVLVVTTPEPTAVTDAYAVIKTLYRQKPGASVLLLVNMVRDEVEARQVFGRLSAVCRKFLQMSLRYAGHLPSDPRVQMSIRRRQPFALDASATAARAGLSRLAHRLDRHATSARSEGLFRRMASWLAR